MKIQYLWVIFTCMSFVAQAQQAKEEQAIDKVLSEFHQAAADANAKIYLNLLTDDAIFLGTDATERWTKTQFTDFVLPYFNQGKGWVYVAKERNVSLLSQHKVAFFDEVLENKKYGYCRGSGVLVQTDQGWKISQYNLTFLVPNDIAEQVAATIQTYKKTQ